MAFLITCIIIVINITSSYNEEVISEQGDDANLSSFSASGLTPIEELGKYLFFDKISEPNTMSCAECHALEYGFSGPDIEINLHGAVYMGAVAQRFGNRRPPTAAYATYSPVFYFDEKEEHFVGGNFWDGRATGEVLGNPAADQAIVPFLNPLEHNAPNKKTVIEIVANSEYAGLWEEVWGSPIRFDDKNIDAQYDQIGLAIAAYEASSEVNQFSSKFDYFLKGNAVLSAEEIEGLALFNGKALCSECHPSVGVNGDPPLFTDFTYDNLGVPKNPENPYYKMNKVYLENGDAINPLGDAWIDYGLGAFLEASGNPRADENMGKHKVPTLRNVAKSPEKGITKSYMHNGVFKSLKEVVNFYNTRDTESWPPPEVGANINIDELGDLGLTEEEENAIVAFMETLSDGYIKD